MGAASARGWQGAGRRVAPPQSRLFTGEATSLWPWRREGKESDRAGTERHQDSWPHRSPGRLWRFVVEGFHTGNGTPQESQGDRDGDAAALGPVGATEAAPSVVTVARSAERDVSCRARRRGPPAPAPLSARGAGFFLTPSPIAFKGLALVALAVVTGQPRKGVLRPPALRARGTSPGRSSSARTHASRARRAVWTRPAPRAWE